MNLLVQLALAGSCAAQLQYFGSTLAAPRVGIQQTQDNPFLNVGLAARIAQFRPVLKAMQPAVVDAVVDEAPSCEMGQGQAGASLLSVQEATTQEMCAEACAAYEGELVCVAFDVTTESKKHGCRLYAINEPRLGDTGKNRQYCTMGTAKVKSVFDEIASAQALADAAQARADATCQLGVGQSKSRRLGNYSVATQAECRAKCASYEGEKECVGFDFRTHGDITQWCRIYRKNEPTLGENKWGRVYCAMETEAELAAKQAAKDAKTRNEAWATVQDKSASQDENIAKLQLSLGSKSIELHQEYHDIEKHMDTRLDTLNALNDAKYYQLSALAAEEAYKKDPSKINLLKKLSTHRYAVLMGLELLDPSRTSSTKNFAGRLKLASRGLDMKRSKLIYEDILKDSEATVEEKAKELEDFKIDSNDYFEQLLKMSQDNDDNNLAQYFAVGAAVRGQALKQNALEKAEATLSAALADSEEDRFVNKRQKQRVAELQLASAKAKTVTEFLELSNKDGSKTMRALLAYQRALTAIEVEQIEKDALVDAFNEKYEPVAASVAPRASVVPRYVPRRAMQHNYGGYTRQAFPGRRG